MKLSELDFNVMGDPGFCIPGTAHTDPFHRIPALSPDAEVAEIILFLLNISVSYAEAWSRLQQRDETGIRMMNAIKTVVDPALLRIVNAIAEQVGEAPIPNYRKEPE